MEWMWFSKPPPGLGRLRVVGLASQTHLEPLSSYHATRCDSQKSILNVQYWKPRIENISFNDCWVSSRHFEHMCLVGSYSRDQPYWSILGDIPTYTQNYAPRIPTIEFDALVDFFVTLNTRVWYWSTTKCNQPPLSNTTKVRMPCTIVANPLSSLA